MEMIRGDICCLVAGVGFAVNYLPVKSCNTGDGIFFCAAMSVGILFVGLLTGMFLTSTSAVSDVANNNRPMQNSCFFFRTTRLFSCGSRSEVQLWKKQKFHAAVTAVTSSELRHTRTYHSCIRATRCTGRSVVDAWESHVSQDHPNDWLLGSL